MIVTPSFFDSSRLVASIIEAAILEKPDAFLGLATGSSVLETYNFLSNDFQIGRTNFSTCFAINLDEYLGIDNNHEKSSALFLHKNFFSKTNFIDKNVFLIDGDNDGESELKRISDHLQNRSLDILVLGVGTNGHIGFNEPNDWFIASPHVVSLSQETIEANSRFFKDIDDVPRKCITVGIRDILNARKIILIASGSSKADAIHKLFIDDCITPRLPCSILKLGKDVSVVIDSELAFAAALNGN